MTLTEISLTSVSRANRWHKGGIVDWTDGEWAAAMAGEAGEASEALIELLALNAYMSKHVGEACNAAKKLKRVLDGIPNINLEEGRSLTDVKSARLKVTKEVADTILYGVILAARVGYSGQAFEELLANVFNQKSFEYNFPERLRVPHAEEEM